MKKWIFAIFVLGLLFFSSQSVLAQDDYFCAVYFTKIGCPVCAETDPIVLSQLTKKNPNLIIIEYEFVYQPENVPVMTEYYLTYNLPGWVPLILFENKYSVGMSILDAVKEKVEKYEFNKCSLPNGSSISLEDLNFNELPGNPKIWANGRVLIKTSKGWVSNELLKKSLFNEDLNEVFKGVEFKKIEPIKVVISEGYLEFNHGISIGNWIFQWNGEELELPISPTEERPLEEELTPEEESSAEFELKLTLAKILSLAAVDAINPCALAVLSLMLIAILTYNPTKRRNVLLAGLAFVTAVFLLYLIYGLVIIKSFQLIQALTFIRLWLYKILGIGAIILGFFKLKDFFWHKAVCTISPRVDKIVAKITSPRGAFLAGAFVTIFLLPCTVGPYIICGGILCPLGILKALPWLSLYNLIFILPMLAVVLIIYLGLGKIEDISSWQARNIRYLHLVTGLTVLGLGIAMILGLV
ncbi:hypothetical protein ES703_26966 [subsurface metagenome]